VEREAFPRVAYVSGESQLLGFVRRFHPSRMVCCSLNWREEPRVGRHGFAVASREDEVLVSRSLLLDFDVVGVSLPSRVAALERFVRRGVVDYFRDHGFVDPSLACSGGGFHVLAAYPPVHVAQFPDVRDRLRAFRDEVAREFRGELSRLEVALDRTQDLRRMVKLYGTAKVGGEVSRFFGGARVPDPRLREYVLSRRASASGAGGVRLELGGAPSWLAGLLERDVELASLWRGEKPVGTDASQSGLDYSVARRLLRLGRTDVAEVACALAARPGSRALERGEAYVRRTIGAALQR
jgi:hypothetical protein